MSFPSPFDISPDRGPPYDVSLTTTVGLGLRYFVTHNFTITRSQVHA